MPLKIDFLSVAARGPRLSSIRSQPDQVLLRGGSAIIGPQGDLLAGPILDEETMLIAEIDFSAITRESLTLDVTGQSSQCLKMPSARMRASLSKIIAPGTTVVDIHDRMCVAKSPPDSAGTIAGADVMHRGDLMRSSRILECGFRFALAELLDLSADRGNRHRTSFHASSAQLRDPRLVLATLATP